MDGLSPGPGAGPGPVAASSLEPPPRPVGENSNSASVIDKVTVPEIPKFVADSYSAQPGPPVNRGSPSETAAIIDVAKIRNFSSDKEVNQLWETLTRPQTQEGLCNTRGLSQNLRTNVTVLTESESF